MFKWIQKLPVIFWLSLTTTLVCIINWQSLNFLLAGLLLLHLAAFYLSEDAKTRFAKSSWVWLIDFAQILVLSGLMFVFNDIGALYLVFFFSLITFAAFNYTRAKFIVEVAVIVFALSLIYGIKGYGNTAGANLNLTFYEIYFMIGSAFVLRMFAKQSLSLKRRQEVLEQSLDVLRHEKSEVIELFDNIDNVIVSLDVDGRVVFYNKSAKNVFKGIKEKESLASFTHNIKLLDRYGKNVSFKALIKEAEKAKIFRNDLEFVSKKERIQNFNLSISPVLNEGKDYQGVIILIHNLTKEEELDKSKLEFASVASHEIRTPLTVFEGYLQLLLTSDKFSYDESTKKYLEMLHQSSVDLLKLANDILTVTKIQENKLTPILEEINLETLLKVVVKENAEKAKAKNIKLELAAAKDLPEVKSDSSKIKEIISNLIDNGIKFTQEGGVTVAAEKVKDSIYISVADTGTGISKEAQEKIFEKFYREEAWQTRNTGGTGLGLYICKSLANRLGGEVIFESRQNKGSKFTLIIPIEYKNKDDIIQSETIKVDEFIKSF